MFLVMVEKRDDILTFLCFLKKLNMSSGSKDIDGGYAWVILCCGFFTYVINGVLAYSMGIITEAMLDVFHGDLSLTSVVGSAILGTLCCIGPLAGFIGKKVGCRACAIAGGIIATVGFMGASFSRDLHTLLIFGVLTGMGYSLPYISCCVMVGLYFHRLRPLAAGIMVTGASFGMFSGPPIVRYLIDYYGLHGTFLIMAGMSFHFCVIGILLRPLPGFEHLDRNTANAQKDKFHHNRSSAFTLCKKIKIGDICPFRLWKNIGFTMYLLSSFFWSMGESACLIHLPNYCIEQGSSKADAALLFTAMGVASMFSRLLTGFAANDEGISAITLHSGIVGVAGILTALFPLYSRTYGGQLAYATAIGIYSSAPYSLQNPIIVLLVGVDDLGIGIGLLSFLSGLGYITGPPIAGAIVDYGASYRESYLFAGSVFLLASLSAMMIPLFHSAKVDHIVPEIRSEDGIDIPLQSLPVDTCAEMNSVDVSQTDYQLEDRNDTEREL